MFCRIYFIKAGYIAASIICGLAAGPLWIAHARYIEGLCKDDIKQTGTSFGIFYGIYSSAALLTGLLSKLILEKYESMEHFKILATIAFISSIFLFWAPHVVDREPKPKDFKFIESCQKELDLCIDILDENSNLKKFMFFGFN